MAEKTCNVPGCEKPVSGRGLCGMHWFRATKGKDGPAKDEALRYANPARGKGDKPESAGEKTILDKAANAAEKREKSLPRRIDQAQARKAEEADERIAAITEFATAMGIDHIDYHGGRLYPCPKTDNFIFLTESGNIQEGILNLGTAQ